MAFPQPPQVPLDFAAERSVVFWNRIWVCANPKEVDSDQISSDNAQKDVVPAATPSIEIASIESTGKEEASIAPSTTEISVSGVVFGVARGTTVYFLCGGGKGG